MIGGGNVHDASHDDELKVRLNGLWVEIPFGIIYEDGQYVGTKDGWGRFNNYDLAVVTNASGSLDVDTRQVFVFDVNSSMTINLPDLTASDRAKVLVLQFNGDGGVVQFTGNYQWTDNYTFELKTDVTVVTFYWDGTGSRWLGGRAIEIDL